MRGFLDRGLAHSWIVWWILSYPHWDWDGFWWQMPTLRRSPLLFTYHRNLYNAWFWILTDNSYSTWSPWSSDRTLRRTDSTDRANKNSCPIAKLLTLKWWHMPPSPQPNMAQYNVNHTLRKKTTWHDWWVSFIPSTGCTPRMMTAWVGGTSKARKLHGTGKPFPSAIWPSIVSEHNTSPLNPPPPFTFPASLHPLPNMCSLLPHLAIPRTRLSFRPPSWIMLCWRRGRLPAGRTKASHRDARSTPAACENSKKPEVIIGCLVARVISRDFNAKCHGLERLPGLPPWQGVRAWKGPQGPTETDTNWGGRRYDTTAAFPVTQPVRKICIHHLCCHIPVSWTRPSRKTNDITEFSMELRQMAACM